jgi:hypothetical protein
MALRLGFGACAPEAIRLVAAWLEHRERLLRDVTADPIENSIATRHDLQEILRIVIDDLIGTEVAQIVTVHYTRGRDDTCTAS